MRLMQVVLYNEVPIITAAFLELLSNYAIVLYQGENTLPKNSGFVLSDELWNTYDVKLYIKDDDEELKLRTCIPEIFGLGGRRGIGPTTKVIKEKVIWTTLDSDVESFVQSCFVCLLSETGSEVTPLDWSIDTC